MNLRNVLLPVLAILLSGISAQDFTPEALKDKLNEKDLIFAATFDERHVNADVGKGRRENLQCPDVSLGLRGEIGFDGQQAFLPGKNEELMFALKDNFNHDAGSLSMWARVNDFDPADPNFKKNVGLFNVVFRKKGEHMENFAYLYGGTLYFMMRHFIGDKPEGMTIAALKDHGLKKDEWFQLLWTWDRDKYRLYLNGEPIGSHDTPPAWSRFGGGLGGGSYMGFNSDVWGLRREVAVSLDDIKVFSSVMSPLMVKNRYARLKKERPADLKQVAFSFSGIDRGHEQIPLLRISVDGRCLPGNPQEVDYELKGGVINQNGRLKLTDGQADIKVEIPAGPAEYTITVKSGAVTESASYTTPDLSFVHAAPRPDEVPAPWTPPVLDSERAVSVWNRRYEFGHGPFPLQVTADGKPLLSGPVELTANGAKIDWTAGATESGKSFVKLTGQGKGNGFSIDYTTLIEFDGMVKCDFTINGSPNLNQLKLNWQIAPGFRRFLMTPKLVEKADSVYRFGYPEDQNFHNPFLIWLSSEKAGFCWVPGSDANWVNAKPDQAISVDRTTGKCEVNLISKAIKVPEGTAYNSFFAATPTRPAPQQVRGNYNDRIYIMGWGEKYAVSYEIDEARDEVMLKKLTGVLREKSLIPYAMGYGLSLQNPIAGFMLDSWTVPQMRIYNEISFVPLYDEGIYKYGNTLTMNACGNNTTFADYVIHNQKKLLEYPLGNRVGMIYFDLGNTLICRNRFHGCGFTDKFGREVGSLNIMAMRDLYIRSLFNVRAAGIPLMNHAQHCFTPIVNGLADYWYPGEQFNGMLRRNPNGYTDVLSDDFYLSEINRDVMGPGMIFLPALMSVKLERTPEHTEGMMSMLLLHDIDLSPQVAYQQVPYLVWEVFKHYQIHDPAVKLHKYDTQNEIKSSNPAVRITWYECPGDYKLLILSNKTAEAAKSAIDISAVASGSSEVRDEYRNVAYPVTGGKFEISVPPRSFAVVGLPAKPWFPYLDGFEFAWDHYMNNIPSFGNWSRSKLPHHDRGVYRSASPAMVVPPFYKLAHDRSNMRDSAKTRHTYAKIVPVETGKTYTAEIWGKTSGLPQSGKAMMHLQPLDAAQKPAGAPVSAQLRNPNGDWEKISAKITISAPDVKWLRIELEGVNIGDAHVCFDDFSIQ